MILFWVIQHRLHNSPMKLCFYYYYKHQADTEIPTPGKYGDMGTEDVPLRSAKRDKGLFTPSQSSTQAKCNISCHRISWGYIKMEEPWDDKGKYHTSKQEIQKPVSLPAVLSLCRVHGCRCYCCYSIIWLIPLLQLGLIYTSNIACNWSTDLTGPAVTYRKEDYYKVTEK